MMTRTTRAAPADTRALQIRIDLTQDEIELLAGGSHNTAGERDDAARAKVIDLVAAFFAEA